ncbi:hypothetical protein PHLGIDRAFT_98327 [Phlebiopsis gigantea 11061_1 CR5-6]|uniref:Uncharacterized protein n=1 Tax=Phlebiopsis gigantea (strain 11061_1 CR5-6) TaxID=745531 RepID=A0A0C3P368_PHLG1|nr:hypothetical protein PHLGIDRAFT_98327 [Phlebiopsis gigantea 11061_1 CR5-6]
MPKKVNVKAKDVSDVSDNENAFDEAEDDQDSMLEMIALVKQFQKRKTTKNSAKSAAFEAKKDALYTEARKNAANAIKEGIAYIEQYKLKISELKAREISQDHYLKGLSLFQTREEAMAAVLAAFPPLLDDLCHRRAEAINETSAMRKHVFYVCISSVLKFR